MKRLIAISLLCLGATSFAKTVTSFNEIQIMSPGTDLTITSQVQSDYLEGHGRVYFVAINGATCDKKAIIPNEFEMGGVYVRDKHISLKNGESSEVNGTLYICTDKRLQNNQLKSQQQR